MRCVYSTWLHACHTVGVQRTVSLTQMTKDRVGENTKGRKEEGSEAEKSDTQAARLLCVSGQPTYSQKISPLEGGGDGGT